MSKKERKKSTFWSDFKKFITKGNVIDMAVGVVIGGAFSKIVTGLVNYIINPCVSLLTKGSDLDSIKTVLVAPVEAQDAVLDEVTGAVITPAVEEVKEVAILWGTWIQTILDFLIVAFCIFFVLRIIMRVKNKLNEKEIEEAKAKEAEAAAKAEADKKAAAEVAAAVAARQKELEDSQLRQEKLLSEICEVLKNK